MEAKILKKIMEDSPIAYLKFNAILINGKYSDIKICSINKAFADFFNKKKDEITREDLIAAINYKYEDMDNILKIAKKNEKYTAIKFFSKLERKIKMDFYSGDDNTFYLIFNELAIDNINLSKLMKNSPFAAWIKDREGKYLDVNDAYLDVLKLPYDKVVGKTDFDLFRYEVAKHHVSQDSYVLQTDSLEIYKEDLILGDYEKRYFQTAKWPYIGGDNLRIGIVGITTDITDSVRLKESIKRNDELFNEIADNIEDVIIAVDKNKALYVSPAFEKVFNLKPDVLYNDINALNGHFKLVYYDEEYDYNYTGITSHTIRLLNDNGFDKWFVCKFVPVFGERNNIIKKIGVISDITKTMRLQEELERLRVDFFTNLSHELRTPINLILSSLEVIKLRVNKLCDDDKEYLNKYLGIVNQNGLRLLKLVNNLIDTTRIDSGSFPCNPTNYDIISFVENICMSVSEFINTNNMNIIFDTNVEEKIIAFDLDNMERIILNLISNAIKFNKEGGNIQVTINCSEDIKISVKDEGIGVPKDKIENIFGRFEQVRNRIKKNVEGSGIGLSLVKSLVNMHGGEITVESEIGSGTEFIITLPDRLCDENCEEEVSQAYENVNMMKVEFSDIYI